MKRQFFINTLAVLFCCCYLSNIKKVNAEPSTCTNVEDGCLKINEMELKKLQIEIINIVANTKTIVPSGTPLESSTILPINQEVSFTIDNLWELKVPKGGENGLNVEYSNLQNPNLNSSEMQLSIIKKAEITTRDSTEEGYYIVTGGATLKFNLSTIKASGNYLGNLRVEVTPGEVSPAQ
jgi:hypothetical protein